MLQQGEKAPDFTLTDGEGKSVTLSQYQGQKLIIYFYPKDSTAGCTKQAKAYAAADEELKTLGVKVIGISKDSVASHKKFAEKYALPFTLLSDPERQAIEGYGVWQEKKMCGKVSMGVVRSSFLIDEEGRLELVRYNVKADKDTAELLAYLKK